MRFSDAFDSVSDWMMEGSLVSSIVKTCGVAGLAGGALLTACGGVLNYFANRNLRTYESTISDIDHTRNLTFRNVEDCTSRGLPLNLCQESQQSALDWVDSLGTTVSYDTMGECRVKHGNTCNSESNTTTIYVNTGNNVMVPITTTTTEYKPVIVGWQASIENLKKAIPLYSSSSQQVGVRSDGVTLKLN